MDFNSKDGVNSLSLGWNGGNRFGREGKEGAE